MIPNMGYKQSASKWAWALFLGSTPAQSWCDAIIATTYIKPQMSSTTQDYMWPDLTLTEFLTRTLSRAAQIAFDPRRLLDGVVGLLSAKGR
jgi:hypothetical protein